MAGELFAKNTVSRRENQWDGKNIFDVNFVVGELVSGKAPKLYVGGTFQSRLVYDYAVSSLSKKWLKHRLTYCLRVRLIASPTPAKRMA
ncbi:MAG: hypothetical protein ABIJ15_08435 [bacterium]